MITGDPREILGVSAEAGDEEIRAAYLAKIKQFPPDRHPEEFERVRDAYDHLRDPRQRTRNLLMSADPNAPLERLLEGHRRPRRYAGPKPWLAAMKEQ
jgi:preprotein translocase subunit Sec63